MSIKQLERMEEQMHTLFVLHFRDGVSICGTHLAAQGWPLTLSPQDWHYRGTPLCSDKCTFGLRKQGQARFSPRVAVVRL